MLLTGKNIYLCRIKLTDCLTVQMIASKKFGIAEFRTTLNHLILSEINFFASHKIQGAHLQQKTLIRALKLVENKVNFIYVAIKIFKLMTGMCKTLKICCCHFQKIKRSNFYKNFSPTDNLRLVATVTKLPKWI